MIKNRHPKNERRQYKRQIVYEGMHAIINLDYQIEGQIINISRDGLCFCYVNKDDNNLKNIETEVYLDNNGKFIAKLPCKIIWDRKISYSSTKGQDLIRECGVQFRECNENQIAQLNYFFERDIIEISETINPDKANSLKEQ